MKKWKYKIIGLLVIILGVAMFIFGVSMFTYQGKSLNPIVSKLGMYSFIFWLPTIIVGIVFMFIKNRKKQPCPTAYSSPLERVIAHERAV